MELLGTRYTASSLAAELLKDRAFFRRSDRGGVTLSGGEASAQGPFARETLRLLSEAGVHTALDTCGLASWEVLASLYPHVDLLLWDLKEIDPVLHERYTGLDNRLILANLEKTADWMRCHEKPRSLWIRTPIIPCATDREENLLGLGRAIARIAPPRLERWELCAFNNLCADKYLRLGKAWPYAARPLMAESDMERLTAAAQRGLGGHPLQATWTGSTRLETAREEA
jgi:pyruvate formate lyase activating enzyme